MQNYYVDCEGNSNIFDQIHQYQVLGKIDGKVFEITKISALSFEHAEEMVAELYPGCWIFGRLVTEINL